MDWHWRHPHPQPQPQPPPPPGSRCSPSPGGHSPPPFPPATSSASTSSSAPYVPLPLFIFLSFPGPTFSADTNTIFHFRFPDHQDAVGVVARLSECIASRGGNIHSVDVFVPDDKPVFYSRRSTSPSTILSSPLLPPALRIPTVRWIAS